jgi:hypothetical protein
LELSNFDARNGWFGEIRCAAKSVPPQLQTNAAPAAWPNVNVGKVRTADLYAKRSEGPVSALCADMCVAQHLSLSAHNFKRLTFSHPTAFNSSQT